jgi:hypothetical protein
MLADFDGNRSLKASGENLDPALENLRYETATSRCLSPLWAVHQSCAQRVADRQQPHEAPQAP